MRRRWITVLLFLPMLTSGQDRVVRGSVTYVASGVIYTSLGRESGVSDSSTVFVVQGADTVGVLVVTALSSKSSACRVVRSSGEIRIGSDVVAYIESKTREESLSSPVTADTAATRVREQAERSWRERTAQPQEKSAIELRGRVSARMHRTQYEQASFSITQPGLVLSLRAQSTELPLSAEVFANVRTLAYGNASPFGSSAVNRSRIYRVALTYDDGTNTATFGRQVPAYAPSIGYIDGAALTRRFGDVVVGTAAGFQPGFDQRSISTDYRKMALFASLLLDDAGSARTTAAYARTYFGSRLDREVFSTSLTGGLTPELSVYASGEFDLRSKSGEDFRFDPRLSTMYVSAHYRVSSMLSVGAGGNASRPVYSYSAVRFVPDSLLEHRLRGGASGSFTLRLPAGISVYNVYSPRSGGGSFGSDFSDYATVSVTNVAATGINLRSNLNISRNQYARSLGYGVNIQRTLIAMVDFTLRYQRYTYTVRRTGQQSHSTSLGADIIVPINSWLAWFMTYDRLEGYGTRSNSFFTELSVRF
jgi:hypothetical protein